MEDVYDLFKRGTALLEAGDFNSATVPLAKAAELEPEKTSIREALGRAYFRSARFEHPFGPLRQQAVARQLDEQAGEGRPEIDERPEEASWGGDRQGIRDRPERRARLAAGSLDDRTDREPLHDRRDDVSRMRGVERLIEHARSLIEALGCGIVK